jgi:hypothetical protein
VRAGAVVVAPVLTQDLLQVALVQDEAPVEAVLSHGAHPALGPLPPHPDGSGPVSRRDRLGGLLHEYERVAA